MCSKEKLSIRVRQITGRKEATEFGLGESVVLQLTEKLNGRSFDNFFTSPSLLRKLTEHLLYGIGVV